MMVTDFKFGKDEPMHPLDVGSCTFKPPEVSNWQADICGVNYIPPKGTEPNRFHRWMHKLAFGIVWSKRDYDGRAVECGSR